MADEAAAAAAAGKRGVADMSQPELVEVVKKLRSIVTTLTEQKSKLEAEKDELRAKALTLVQRCKQLEETAATTTAVAPSPLPSGELEKKLEETSAELAKYKATVDRAVPKLRELKAQLDAKTEECKRLEEQTAAMKSEAAAAAAAPTPASPIPTMAAALEQAAQHLENDAALAAAIAERDKAKEGVAKAMVALKDLRAKLDAASSGLDDETKRRAKCEQELADAKAHLAQAETEIQCERLTDSKIQEELREVLVQLRQELVATQQDKTVLTATCAKLNAELESLRADKEEEKDHQAFALNVKLKNLDSLETDYSRAMEDMAQLRAENEVLIAHIAEKEKVIADFGDVQAQLQKKGLEQGATQQHIATLNQEISQRVAERNDLQKQLKAMQEKAQLQTTALAEAERKLIEYQKNAAAEKASLELQLAEVVKAATAEKAASQNAASAEKEALEKQIATLQASGSDASAQLTAQLATPRETSGAFSLLVPRKRRRLSGPQGNVSDGMSASEGL